MIQQEKNAKMDAIVARMLMRKEGIPESIAGKAINIHNAQANSVSEVVNPQPQDKNAKMATIIARMANPPESVPTRIVNIARDLTMHQNYVDSLQMEREKRMAEERDAHEKIGKSLGLQPFVDAYKKIQRNNKRLLDEKELERICHEYGINYKSLSEEDKAKFLGKCLP